MLPKLLQLTNLVFSDLQKLLRTRSDESLWGELFSTVFLCLIVIGKTQVSLAERALTGSENGDFSYTDLDARTSIEEIERELSTPLVGMFHLRFGTIKRGNGMGKSFNPFSANAHYRLMMSSLMESILQATKAYGECLPLTCREL